MMPQVFDGNGIVLHLDDEETKANNGLRYKAYPPDGQDGFVRSYKTLQEAIAYAKGGGR